MSGTIDFENRGGAGWITINRPQAKNAMTFDMVRRFLSLLDELADDEDCRLIVLQGAGKDFSSGADVGDLASVLSMSSEQRTAEFRRGVDEMVVPLHRAFDKLRQPVIASVRGHAIGVAFQMALSADLVVASETTRFTVPQVKLGHTLDHGESWYLPRLVGKTKALQLALMGDPLTGEQAERLGLVNWLTTDDALETKTLEIAERLLGSAPESVRGTKALLRNSLENSLEDQLAAERNQVGVCAGTEDFVEALTAFQEKRKPRFVGR